MDHEDCCWHPTVKDYLFSLEGRIGRFEFFLFQFAVSLVLGAVQWVGFLLIGMAAGFQGGSPWWFGVAAILLLLVQLATLWPALALAVKRCHDRNRSGWFVLVGFVPILNLWYLVEMVFLRGTDGENKYGPPSWESVSDPADKVCPQCGTDYGFIDRLTRPRMCKGCWQAHRQAA